MMTPRNSIILLAGALVCGGLLLVRGQQPEPLSPEMGWIAMGGGTGAVASPPAACASPCTGVLYLWSAGMPLSETGITDARTAAEALGVELVVAEVGPGTVVADPLEAAGATTHLPSLSVYRDGELVGPSILGYKVASAWRSLIERRLEPTGRGVDPSEAAGERPKSSPGGARSGPSAEDGARGPSTDDASRVRLDWAPAETLGTAIRDYPVSGAPGAYFRWVPRYDMVAYEAGRTVYLMPLDSGEPMVGPGFIDFVPTPDGAWFVTPGPGRDGLEFYSAEEVFPAARAGRGARVEPVFNDREMRDQYPSVGILERSETRTVYRVLTSWTSTVVYRDYEVLKPAAGGRPTIRRITDPVRPCRDIDLSIPIISQDGMEVAGRDEATGTTKIFRMGPEGACDEVLDTGLQTRKVAWHQTGTRIAFTLAPGANLNAATLPVQAAPGTPEPVGVFILDRTTRRMTAVAGSAEVSQVAFPDFIGDDRIVFLIPGPSRSRSIFRVVDGIG